ncbi:MAG: hypothetical protein HKL95_10590 [Phycisphaerae bacterium]|nr:hypothetical protein [Phycisphaerae bacterium]
MQNPGTSFWQQPLEHGLASHFMAVLQQEKFLSAAILVVLGLLLLLLSRWLYRWIIAVDVIAMGWVLAMVVADKSLLVAVVVVAVAVIAAIALVPMLEMAFALVGAVAGCLMGMAVSHWMHSPPEMVLLAAILGLIAVGVMSFLVFRAALIFFFTLQGSAMFVGGLLALLREDAPVAWNRWALKARLLTLSAFVLLTLGVACLGTLIQQWQWSAREERDKAAGWRWRFR